MEDLLSPEQLAAKLGCKVSAVYNWIYKRQIPYCKAGALVRFRPSEIELWLKGVKAESSPMPRKIKLPKTARAKSTRGAGKKTRTFLDVQIDNIVRRAIESVPEPAC
jgi:excisionase family DNA binding protein